MVKKAAQATPNLLLKAARKERGWTQQDVADRIGAPLALNVSRWESGTAFPSAYYLQKLCHLFGKSPGELGLSQLEAVTAAASAPSLPSRAEAPSSTAHDRWRHETAKPGPSLVVMHPGSDNEQEPVYSPAAPIVWMLPYPRNLFFLGREDVLAYLRHYLHGGQMMALSQPQAINGLGGVGKTQVALEYAYRYAQDYQAVFWMRADSRDALVAGFREMASALNLPERDEREQAITVAAVKGWLSQRTSWLLIVDNADELSLLPEFLPSPVRGHLLLTTRAQALGRLANRIEIDTLDAESAALLLLRRAGLLALDVPLTHADPADRLAALRLAEELGGLPLALDQAGAYLEETRCGLQQYLDLYQSHRAELLRRRGGVVQDHPQSVTTTWSLSFAAIEQADALAADLLRLCALLHPDAIPEDLFLQGATHLGPRLSALETDPLAFNQALAVIQRYSLLRRTSREQTLSIHRLVRVVLQDAMSPQEQVLWSERATAALNAIFPEVRHQGWAHWRQCGRLLPHVLTLAAGIPTERDSVELASLLTKTADYLLQSALYEQAEPLYQRALSLCERILGREHPEVAFPLNGLADLYRARGQYEQAEPLYQRAVRLWETLGEEHPRIPCPLNNLAILYAQQGDFSQAEALLQRDLHVTEQRLGPPHPEMASPLNNLAILYRQQGKYDEAEPLLQRALSIDERTFGQDHPEIAHSLTNLAELYQAQGRYEEAEPLFQRALRIREQTLGREHPEVAYPLKGLADLYREQGRYEQAEPLYQRALAILQRRGAWHLETAEILLDYARFHELRSQPDQAIPLYQQALAIREQRLGPDHPLTADTRARYTDLLHVCGRSK